MSPGTAFLHWVELGTRLRQAQFWQVESPDCGKSQVPAPDWARARSHSVLEIHLGSSPMRLGMGRARRQEREWKKAQHAALLQGEGQRLKSIKSHVNVSCISFLFVRECLVGGGEGPCLDASDKYCVQWVFTACTHEAGHQTPHPLYLMFEQV